MRSLAKVAFLLVGASVAGAGEDNVFLNSQVSNSSTSAAEPQVDNSSLVDTVPSTAPSPSPRASYTQNNDWDTTTSVDILVAALFLIAAGWLVLAIIYSVLILILVRMRARGELDIYDENFGRLFLLGRRCYIPLGCLLRRHVVALNRRNQTVRLMTREERRGAMEELLAEGEQAAELLGEEGDREEDAADSSEERSQSNVVGGNDDLESNGEPVCSICLMEYEAEDVCFTSPTCVHRFHRDCLMDWLERRNHTECPCCREAMVSDDDVWETVQRMRREQRKWRRRQNRQKGILGWCTRRCCGERNPMGTPEQGEEGENGEEGDASGSVESPVAATALDQREEAVLQSHDTITETTAGNSQELFMKSSVPKEEAYSKEEEKREDVEAAAIHGN